MSSTQANVLARNARAACDFSVTQDITGAHAVLRVQGELDLCSAPQFAAALGAVLDGPRPVVVDLAGVSFVDSAGVAVLVASADRLRSQGSTMTLASPAPMFCRILDLLMLWDRFEFSAAAPTTTSA